MKHPDRVCDCPSDALCPLCLDGRFAQLRGVAECRARTWVDDLLLRTKARDPWPSGSPKVLAIARVKVADLVRDPRLHEMLAKVCADAAEREWCETTAGNPG